MKKKSGFTLIELIVVIAIIGILAAIATPKLQKYKIEAQTQRDLASARSIYKAILAYDTADNFYGQLFGRVYYDPARGINPLAPYLDDNVTLVSMPHLIDGPGKFAIETNIIDGYDYSPYPEYVPYILYFDSRVDEVSDGRWLWYQTALVEGVPVMARIPVLNENGTIRRLTVDEFLASPEDYMHH